MDGNIVHLTSLDPPPAFDGGQSLDSTSESADPISAAVAEFGLLVGEENAEKLRTLSGAETSADTEFIEVGPIPDKTKRTVIQWRI